MMNNENNPYRTSQGGYQGSVTYGTGGPAGNAAPADLIKDTTTAAFAADVIQESRRQPVLVDFWAPWCGPCRQLTPALEKVVREAGGRVKLVKMNIDEHPAIAGQLGIQSIPAVIAFKDGQPVDGFMGAVPESQIRDLITRIGGDAGKGGIEDALAAAGEAKRAGDAETAGQIYSAILAQDPENVDATAALADMLFDAGDLDGARQMLDRAPETKRDSSALAAVRAKLVLAEQAEGLGDPAELQRMLQADPKNHQARFDLAMAQNARGMRGEAADNLLAIIKADRSWNEDAARKQLVQFFEAWGAMDEATLAARRKLSSLLFS